MVFMGDVSKEALVATLSTSQAPHARAQGLYHSEEGGEAGVTEVAAHQLYTRPGWAEPVWRDVVPHFHVMPPRELARFNAAGARGRASPARRCLWSPGRRPPLAAAHPRAHRPRALRSNLSVPRLAAASPSVRRLLACAYGLHGRMYLRLSSTLSSPRPVRAPQKRRGLWQPPGSLPAGDALQARPGQVAPWLQGPPLCASNPPGRRRAPRAAARTAGGGEYAGGYSFTTLICEQRRYLPWLTERVLRAGATLSHRTVTDLRARARPRGA